MKRKDDEQLFQVHPEITSPSAEPEAVHELADYDPPGYTGYAHFATFMNEFVVVQEPGDVLDRDKLANSAADIIDRYFSVDPQRLDSFARDVGRIFNWPTQQLLQSAGKTGRPGTIIRSMVGSSSISSAVPEKIAKSCLASKGSWFPGPSRERLDQNERKEEEEQPDSSDARSDEDDVVFVDKPVLTGADPSVEPRPSDRKMDAVEPGTDVSTSLDGLEPDEVSFSSTEALSTEDDGEAWFDSDSGGDL